MYKRWQARGPPTNPYQTPNTIVVSMAVSLWGISFMDERETAQTTN